MPQQEKVMRTCKIYGLRIIIYTDAKRSTAILYVVKKKIAELSIFVSWPIAGNWIFSCAYAGNRIFSCAYAGSWVFSCAYAYAGNWWFSCHGLLVIGQLVLIIRVGWVSRNIGLKKKKISRINICRIPRFQNP